MERGGSVAICLRNTIPFTLVDTYNFPHNLERVAFSIQTFQGDLLLLSVYRPPSALSSPFHLDNLLHSISLFNSILLAGSHRGAASTLALQANFCLTSSPITTFLLLTLVQLLTSIALSLSILHASTSRLFPLTSTLYVPGPHVTTTISSDHFPISLELGIPIRFCAHTFHRPQYHKIFPEGWADFSSALSNFSFSNLPTSGTTPSANSEYNFITSAILEAVGNSCPPVCSREPRRPKSADPSWWDEECREVEANRKAARRNFRSNPNLYDELLQTERAVKETFRRVKKVL